MLRASDIYCCSTLATSGTSVRSLNKPSITLACFLRRPQEWQLFGGCRAESFLWVVVDLPSLEFPQIYPIQVPWFTVQCSRSINDLNLYAKSSLRTGFYDLISFNRYISKIFFSFSIFPQRTNPKTPQTQTQASHTFHDSRITNILSSSLKHYPILSSGRYHNHTSPMTGIL
jgi:hypothetical protein